jgi:hypothetical protein
MLQNPIFLLLSLILVIALHRLRGVPDLSGASSARTRRYFVVRSEEEEETEGDS